MPTKREIGYRLYTRPSKQRTSVSTASRVGATDSTSSQIRYGYAQGDSADGKVQVKLDNSESVVNCTCDSPIKKGDRVKVIVTESGQLIAMPIGQNIVSYVDEKAAELAEKIAEKGEEILDSVNEDLGPLRDEVQQVRDEAEQAQEDADRAQSAADSVGAKADELQKSLDSTNTTVSGIQKTVSGIESTVSAVSETADAALTAASSLEQDVDGFKTTVSQTYQTKADADSDMAQEVLDRNSAISQSASEILQQVAQNYVNNETGETLATKSEVSQKADEILQTVSEDYVNKETGATLATKSEVSQKADEIMSSVAEEYQTKDAASSAQSSLQSQITQTAAQITAEVSAREEAVTGALNDAKSYTDQKADSITSTVEQNVMNSVGESYYSKTEIDQKTNQISESITVATGTANSAKELAESVQDVADEAKELAQKNGLDDAIPEYAKTTSTTTAPSSGWNTSLPSYTEGYYTWIRYRMVAKDGSVTYSTPQRFEAADDAQMVTTYFNRNSSGLDVGYQGSDVKARVAAEGEFQVLVNGIIRALFGDDILRLGGSAFGIDFGGSAVQMGGPDLVIGSTLPNIMGWGSNSFSVSDIVSMCNNGDFITSQGSSNSIRYWRWANGRLELSGTVRITFTSKWNTLRTVQFPYSFDSVNSYRVFLQIMPETITDSSVDNFNKIDLIPVNMDVDGFQICGWNDHTASLTYNVGWYAVGV